ncbi:hypothetical protein GCM10027271_42610 [Saccharopolyspora gloriosae]|uniref:Flp pilus assembly protein TadG n=1 Tax=Saccharopolyspora gloriosae TaxID=455344 RepID=A0A840NJW4_9PSEU|nr:hypothetical protein [Saccharopolyspora gloriosae]MBB5070443.1 Flp pilus assembly protein TadG [Saccharopolyspora gloriosae]
MNSHDRDRGSVSVLVAVLLPALLLLLALVVDGADRMRALARADAVAAEAARAALTALDTRTPQITLDTAPARSAAQDALTATGHRGEVAFDGQRTVRVTVAHTEPAPIGLLGPVHHVTGRAEAQLGVGTSNPGLAP